MTESHQHWDVFISYASEDRVAIAEPLAKALMLLGLRVWFDQTTLRVGDSLRGKIDEGLSKSRYGVVVLSSAFLKKHWPIRELNGLAQREVDGRKVILPLWCDIDESTIREFSPPLADRVALSWSRGLHNISLELFATVRSNVTNWDMLPSAPAARDSFSPHLLKQLDEVRDEVTAIALQLVELRQTVPAPIPERVAQKLDALRTITPDIEPMLLDSTGRYLYHPWRNKVIGSTLSAEWGESRAEWIKDALSSQVEGHLSWIDSYASDHDVEIEFRAERRGYQRRTVAAFRRVGADLSSSVTVFVEGHEVHNVGHRITSTA